jgi:hypothetical protein
MGIKEQRMATQVPIKLTNKGLLIPLSLIQEWDEIEVWQEEERIIVQPKGTKTHDKERDLAEQALREDGLLWEVEQAPVSPPPTDAERTEIARKLGEGKLVSELVIRERENGW